MITTLEILLMVIQACIGIALATVAFKWLHSPMAAFLCFAAYWLGIMARRRP